MPLRFIPPAGPTYDAELQLRFKVLREPLGHAFESVRFPFEAESLHLVALSDTSETSEPGEVQGCVLFHPESKEEGRLFQMAVTPALQKTGLGRELVVTLEKEVFRRGFNRITLHARASVTGFYARLGYVEFGEPFSEVGIPHRMMAKTL